jgi:aquaporin Z
VKNSSSATPVPWLLFCAERIGATFLVGVGLSIVFLNVGQDSSLVLLIPSQGERRLLTGFLFGATGAQFKLLPLGEKSRAHINLAVTLVFRLLEKLRESHTLGCVSAQLGGAILGALPLLAWGERVRSLAYGATLAGPVLAPGSS